jgi:LppP/LprE lipoprotein
MNHLDYRLWTGVASIVIAASVVACGAPAVELGSSPATSPGPVLSQVPATSPPASGVTAAPARPAAPQAPESAPTVTPVACGPDQAAALTSALRQYPADPATGRQWNGAHPLDSNYDPCADLSTILVMIQGGTGSSPVQALMFHRGTFLGTGTLKAYGFTSLDRSATTPDTVTLSYRTEQSCTACGDGIVTKVRYHWDGASVQMLDRPPPG